MKTIMLVLAYIAPTAVAILVIKDILETRKMEKEEKIKPKKILKCFYGIDTNQFNNAEMNLIINMLRITLRDRLVQQDNIVKRLHILAE